MKKFAFREFFEVIGKLGDYGLPPKCEVRVRVRPVLGVREAAPELGRVERVEDGLMELVERARKQILEGSGEEEGWGEIAGAYGEKTSRSWRIGELIAGGGIIVKISMCAGLTW